MATRSLNIKCLTQPCRLMEAPHWDHSKKRLYYVDIYAKNIFSYHTESGKIFSATIKNGPVSVIIPVHGEENKFVLGSLRDFILVSWDGESNIDDLPYEKLTSVEGDRTDTRFNDAKVDASGRIWIGTMGLEKENGQRDPNRGSLYSIGVDLQPKVHMTPVTISNGMDWNSDNNVMYYIDSPTCQVWAFDFDLSEGSITNQRVAFDFKKNNLESSPDGMTIDTDGNLWVASFLGGKILNVDPKNGKLIRAVNMPVKNVTSVAFGGPNLDILYVTTATIGLTDKEKKAQPNAGCLFSIEGLGVKGHLPNNFKLRN